MSLFNHPARLAHAMILLAFGFAPIRAESINAPTTVQASPSMTAQEKSNRDFVVDYYRELVRARHAELASKYFGAYIQHNPNLLNGPAGIIGPKGVINFAKLPPVNPIPEKLEVPPVVSGAKGDFAWVVWEREDKDPKDPSKTYHYNFFDIFRFANGKLEEHWDSAAAKNPNAATAGTPSVPPAPPARLKGTGKLSAEEKKNLQLATMKLKDMQDARLEKMIDPDYLEHDPNIPLGRAGFMSQVGRTQSPDRKKSPVSLTLVSGPYVFVMWDITAQDPTVPGMDYTYNQFDLTRIEKGLVKEHWNDMKMPPPEQK
jgi:predicted SnoaL-like aldol condensation-catalyzing enzyme